MRIRMKLMSLRGGPVRLALVASLAASIAAATPALFAQAAQPGPWKVLFDGKVDPKTTFTIPAGRGGRAGAPPVAENAPWGWHVENGVLIGGETKPGERTGGLNTLDKYYDFELELEFILGEVPNVKCSEELGPKEENLSDPACVGNSGISYRSGYQLNIGRREGGEYIGLVIHR